ncbi:MAG: rhodanese-like domain-containing protein [Myxococcota bacterium]
MTDENRVFPDARPSPWGFLEITPADLQAQRGKVLIIDVREPPEYTGELGHVAGSQLVPLSGWPAAAASLDRSKPMVCVCRSGKRSAQAAAHLIQSGAREVYNLMGGMMGWADHKLPVER